VACRVLLRTDNSIMQTVRKSLEWVFAAKLIGQVLSWVITFVVLRLLSPADYGLMALATVFVSFLSMFADMGLGVALIQARDLSRAQLSQMFGAMLLLNGALTLALWLGAPLAALFFDEPRLVELLRVLCFQFLFGAFGALPLSLLQREMRFKAVALIEVSAGLVAGLSTLTMAWGGFGVWALVAGGIVLQAWQALWATLVGGLRVWPSFSFGPSQPLLRAGGFITTSRLLWYFMSQADVLVVGKLLGPAVLGAYAVAVQLSTMPMNRVMSVVNQVGLSAFARIQDDRVAVERNLVTGSAVISFVAFPLFWGIAAVAPTLVPVLLGPKWQQAVLPLQLIPLIIPFRMLGNFVATAIQGMGRPDIELRATATGAVILPLAFLVGARWGVEGVCWAWVLVVPILFMHNVRSMVTVLAMHPLKVLSAIKNPGLWATQMYVSIWATLRLSEGYLPQWLQLVTATMFGAFVYLIGYKLQFGDDLRSRLAIIRGKRV
jgi:teichuronic acid exporter